MKNKYIDMLYILDGFDRQKSNVSFDVIVLDKNEGLLNIETTEWEDIVWELRSELLLKKEGRVRTGIGVIWNEYSAHFREYIGPIMQQYLKQYCLSKVCIDSILFDLSTLRNYKLLQEKFEIESKFHDRMLMIYEGGYIPVGYKGEYPEGQFKVMQIF